MALVQTNALAVAAGSPRAGVAPFAEPDRSGPESRESRRRGGLGFPVRVLGAAVAFGLLAYAFRGLDLGRALSRVGALGPAGCLLFVPSIVAVSCETFAWQHAIAKMAHRVRFSSLFRIRVASESLASVLPLGALWAEAARPPLLARTSSLTVGEGVASAAARKYLLVLSQSGYLLLAFLFGRAIVEGGFRRATGVSGLSSVVLLGAAALAVAAEVSAMAFRGGSVFRAIRTIAGRFTRDGVRAAALREGTARTDRAAIRFFGLPRASRVALAAPCLAGWLLEATETWVFLVALGAHVPWTGALGVEAVVVLGRHLLVFLPGGLGVLELGYATFFVGSGATLDVCGAFVVLKRLKELSWAALGYLIWTMDRPSK